MYTRSQPVAPSCSVDQALSCTFLSDKGPDWEGLRSARCERGTFIREGQDATGGYRMRVLNRALLQHKREQVQFIILVPWSTSTLV